MERIYLDNNATTPVAEEVLAVMAKALAQGPANPSSMHWFGKRAKHQLISARESLAVFFGVQPQDLFFTSGGTESINFLLHGLSKRLPKGKIITSNVEHAAVESTLQILENEGWIIDRIPVGLYGNVREEQIRGAIDEKTRFLFLTAVNSETGVKAPIQEIAALAEEKSIPLLIDGVAWLGKEPLSLPKGVSAIAFSSHKIHGPKGVGLVILRSLLKNIPPLLTGGFQEFNKRAGTENLEGILGFTAAVEALQKAMPEAEFHMKTMRDRLENALIEQCGAIVNGQGPRSSNTSNLCFPGIDGETLLIQFDLAGLAASHGSACSSGSLEPSRILTNMGLAKHHVQSSIRFSTSRLTRMEDIERAISLISAITSQLSNLASECHRRTT